MGKEGVRGKRKGRGRKKERGKKGKGAPTSITELFLGLWD